MSDLTNHYLGSPSSNNSRDPFDLFTVLMAVLVFVLYTVVFCSCTRTEYITTEVHDTLRVTKCDTLVHERIKETVTVLRDSVSHTEEYRRGNGVDTLIIHDLKIIERNNEVSFSDSTLRSIVDSVAKSMVKEEEHPQLPTPVKKPLTFWQKLFIGIGKLSTAVLSLILIYLSIKRNWLIKFIALLKKIV